MKGESRRTGIHSVTRRGNERKSMKQTSCKTQKMKLLWNLHLWWKTCFSAYFSDLLENCDRTLFYKIYWYDSVLTLVKSHILIFVCRDDLLQYVPETFLPYLVEPSSSPVSLRFQYLRKLANYNLLFYPFLFSQEEIKILEGSKLEWIQGS